MLCVVLTNISAIYLQNHHPALSQDEITTVRQTLQSQGIEVETDFVSLFKILENTVSKVMER